MSGTRRILAEHVGRDSVEPGAFLELPVDLVLINDVTAPLAIREFDRMGASPFDAGRIVLVLDHFTPNRDVASAQQCAVSRDFARRNLIEHFYEGGRAGIEHVLLPELGLVKPGEVIVGADSHTCTYGALGAFATGVGSTDAAAAMATGWLWIRVPPAILVNVSGRFGRWVGGKDLILHVIGRLGVDGATYRSLEFAGEGITRLSIEGRLTAANMVIEAGAKNGLFPVDELAVKYLGTVGVKAEPSGLEPDEFGYEGDMEVDLGKIEPQVALPPLPSNVVAVAKAPSVHLDQAVIGSCTNGRIEDLRLAAEVLQGKKASESLRLLIIPGSPAVYRAAMEEGLLEVFLEAGAVISPPTCGPCLGGHMGVLAAGEKAISTTNRNFVGRMGHPDSEVYLANPAVAAASAVTGTITDPGEIV